MKPKVAAFESRKQLPGVASGKEEMCRELPGASDRLVPECSLYPPVAELEEGKGLPRREQAQCSEYSQLPQFRQEREGQRVNSGERVSFQLQKSEAGRPLQRPFRNVFDAVPGNGPGNEGGREVSFHVIVIILNFLFC